MKNYIITPHADEGFFSGRIGLPQGTSFIPNISAVLYASALKEEGKDVEMHDYWGILPDIDPKETEAVHLFVGYANCENGIRLRDCLRSMGVRATLNGVYNFIDGQNFSDVSLLQERGIRASKPAVDMKTRIDYSLVDSLDSFFALQRALGLPRSLPTVSQYYGCPKDENCMHCSSDKLGFGGISTFMIKSPEDTAAEIAGLRDAYSLEEVTLGDLMSTDIRIGMLSGALRGLGAEPPGMRISTAVNYINEDSANDMAGMNCREVFLGVESYNDDVLEMLDKPFRTGDIDRALNILYEDGIRAQASMMLGSPNESERSLEMTRDFVLRWKDRKIGGKPFIRWQVSVLTPAPGSALYDVFSAVNGHEETREMIMERDWYHRLQERYMDLLLEKGMKNKVLEAYRELSMFSESSYVSCFEESGSKHVDAGRLV